MVLVQQRRLERIYEKFKTEKMKIKGRKNGQVFNSPLWIGYRSGNRITRAGYSFKGVQDFLQNGTHTHLVKQNYYLNYGWHCKKYVRSHT